MCRNDFFLHCVLESLLLFRHNNLYVCVCVCVVHIFTITALEQFKLVPSSRSTFFFGGGGAFSNIYRSQNLVSFCM